MIIFRAEFTQVYARHYGSRIQPEEGAQFKGSPEEAAARQPHQTPHPSPA